MEETETKFKSEITFEDFTKMDLRTATILEAEKVKDADKLLKLLLDLGSEKRIVVSGIAKYFSPENIIGKKVTILANLVPRKIKGIESKGMILMAENEKGELAFVSCPEDWSNGMTIS
jgi:methionyl-tRNA synthetase